MRKSIIVPEAPKPAGLYAHAVVANGFVFVAGQGPQIPETGIVPDNFKEQVRQTLKNIRAILRSVGCSMRDVIKVNAYRLRHRRIEWRRDELLHAGADIRRK